jgi:periplasmic protein TonB
MREIFMPQPVSHDLVHRREITLTMSLVAHLVVFSLIAFVVLRSPKVIKEASTIAAFVMEAPPSARPPAGQPKPAAAEPAAKTPEPAATQPVPTAASQTTAEPPSTAVPLGQATGDITQMTGSSAVNVGALGTAPPSGPVRVGGDIKAPALVQKVKPEYPKAAQEAHVKGNVILEAQVGEDGRVQTVKVLRSVAMLDEAAVNAVKQWRYSPLKLNGTAVPFILTVTVTFDLG